jgi:hypothetical protein
MATKRDPAVAELEREEQTLTDIASEPTSPPEGERSESQ